MAKGIIQQFFKSFKDEEFILITKEELKSWSDYLIEEFKVEIGICLKCNQKIKGKKGTIICSNCEKKAKKIKRKAKKIKCKFCKKVFLPNLHFKKVCSIKCRKENERILNRKRNKRFKKK
ncbi:MAG: hypothetical protein LRZ94_00955 [Candidatus Pacebacteria bacterium]|nr:hypothetical protein [Candidatus Paceibacterota bacterium]